MPLQDFNESGQRDCEMPCTCAIRVPRPWCCNWSPLVERLRDPAVLRRSQDHTIILHRVRGGHPQLSSLARIPPFIPTRTGESWGRNHSPTCIISIALSLYKYPLLLEGKKKTEVAASDSTSGIKNLAGIIHQTFHSLWSNTDKTLLPPLLSQQDQQTALKALNYH